MAQIVRAGSLGELPAADKGEAAFVVTQPSADIGLYIDGVKLAGGGVTDHGLLTGLADDDHAQYHTDARGDARYWALATDLATQVELDAVAAAKANVSHLHSGAEITTGTVAEARIDAAIARDSEVTAAISTHEAAADPHVGYQKESEKAAASGYASLDAATRVPDAQLGTGVADATKFLRGDRSWAVPAGGGQAFPVGAVFIAVVATDPATLLGYGTWLQIAGGRMLVGQTGADVDFDVAEEIGGSKTHTLLAAEMPAHSHGITDPGHTHLTQRYPSAVGTSTGFTADTSMSGTPAVNTLPTGSATTGVTVQSQGGGGAHNNMPPYLVVYVWKRTA